MTCRSPVFSFVCFSSLPPLSPGCSILDHVVFMWLIEAGQTLRWPARATRQLECRKAERPGNQETFGFLFQPHLSKRSERKEQSHYLKKTLQWSHEYVYMHTVFRMLHAKISGCEILSLLCCSRRHVAESRTNWYNVAHIPVNVMDGIRCLHTFSYPITDIPVYTGKRQVGHVAQCRS